MATRTAEATTTKTIDEYLALPYHVRLTPDAWDDGTPGWFAEVEELRGCMSQGRTPDEAVESLRDAMVGWISAALEAGEEVPEPRTEEDYSGRFVVRVPRSLHSEVARAAEAEQASLNQFVCAALASAVAWRRPSQPAVPEAVLRLLDKLGRKAREKTPT
jgi:antitoxin HicB